MGQIEKNIAGLEPPAVEGLTRAPFPTTDINAIVKKLQNWEYYDLVTGYYELSGRISDINKSLTRFINDYRNGKEVQL